MTISASARMLGVLLAGTVMGACSSGADGAATATIPANAASAAAAAATGAATAPSRTSRPPRPLPNGVFEMSRVRIMDPSGFDRPIPAASALIPAGWRFEGGIVWGPHGVCGSDYAAKWQAVSPDGASSFQMVPVSQWQGHRSAYPSDPQPNACPQAFYTSVREYLEASAQQLFPGARPLDYRALDQEVQPLRDMMARLPPLPPVQGFQSMTSIDAGELLVGFEENGREMRASLSANATIARTRIADIINPGRIAFESVQGTPSGLIVVKAPNGQLDLGLRRRVLSSIRYEADWSQRVSAFNARKQAEADKTNRAILEINAAGSRERLAASQSAHESRMSSLRATTDIMNGIYNDRQLSSDRQQRERIEAIRGVETYHDPVAGAPVQLDNTYQHAWRVTNRDNTFILTNDVNFDPGAFDIEAQQLKPLP